MTTSVFLLTLPTILHIALLKPLPHCFDYLWPENSAQHQSIQVGCRVLVPFGRTQLVGVLLAINQTPCFPVHKLKHAIAVLDQAPLISSALLALYTWASRYYNYPIGEVILGTLPARLRRPQLKTSHLPVHFKLTTIGQNLKLETLKRSPKQAALLALFQAHRVPLLLNTLHAAGFNTSHLKAAQAKGWIESIQAPVKRSESQCQDALIYPSEILRDTPLTANASQQAVIEQVLNAQKFQTFLLEGVTGSGKTEVYLQLITHQLKLNRQALVLVPEIGLTPQTVQRFQARFLVPVVALHSRLSDKERYDLWMRIYEGEIRVVIGTRSALFAPFGHLGMIILDEEHDPSFKQQSGFKYHARDLAIVRAQLENIPILLGTATPSLESLHNIQLNRFERVYLAERAGQAHLPTFHVIDLRQKKLEAGLSPELLQAIKQHLDQNNQVLLFLNRRGYAPVLLCGACGWSAQCTACDARLTLHQRPERLVCHHCTRTYKVPIQCEACKAFELHKIGLGTQRIEQTLQTHFPNIDIIRIDKDTIRSKQAMQKTLAHVHNAQKQILIGTQMLAKGHHFPNVTLVGIIDIDSALYSPDFRAIERVGQLIIQVAGRAGRAEKAGHVFLQTYQPEYPLLQTLICKGYAAFANELLAQRAHHQWPPFSHLALLRAESMQAEMSLTFLTDIVERLSFKNTKAVDILGPVPATISRKAGFFRYLLLMRSTNRAALQAQLVELNRYLNTLKVPAQLRWALDVDPQELS